MSITEYFKETLDENNLSAHNSCPQSSTLYKFVHNVYYRVF